MCQFWHCKALSYKEYLKKFCKTYMSSMKEVSRPTIEKVKNWKCTLKTSNAVEEDRKTVNQTKLSTTISWAAVLFLVWSTKCDYLVVLLKMNRSLSALFNYFSLRILTILLSVRVFNYKTVRHEIGNQEGLLILASPKAVAVPTVFQ